jgi:enoyl-CoA hydratase/carnithine racemase
MTSFANLTLVFPEPQLAVVSLNRPDAANALTTAMALELKEFFSNSGLDIRAIILTGAGKHFCAGADLKERDGMAETTWKTQHAAFRAARDAIIHCPLPVIAAVNGAAFGGGLELALACDFIYAADTARFALTEATLGIMPGMGGTQLLPRVLGASRAKELLYSGKIFSAREACDWGMVNKLCAPASLLDEAIACAQAIAANAPLAVRAIKQSVDRGMALPPADAFALELKQYNALLPTNDRHEGIRAFNEKRKPLFNGE